MDSMKLPKQRNFIQAEETVKVAVAETLTAKTAYRPMRIDKCTADRDPHLHGLPNM